MIANTLRKYEYTAKLYVVTLLGGGMGDYRRDLKQEVPCHIRVLNKLTWIELLSPVNFGTELAWTRFDSIKSKGGELIFPLVVGGETGRDFRVFDLHPTMDPWGNIFEWKYTLAQHNGEA
jgi:hypothetical protein